MMNEWEIIEQEAEKKYKEIMEKECKFVGASVLEPGLFILLNMSKFVLEKHLKEEIN